MAGVCPRAVSVADAVGLDLVEQGALADSQAFCGMGAIAARCAKRPQDGRPFGGAACRAQGPDVFVVREVVALQRFREVLTLDPVRN